LGNAPPKVMFWELLLSPPRAGECNVPPKIGRLKTGGKNGSNNPREEPLDRMAGKTES